MIASDENVENIKYLDNGASWHMTGNKTLFSMLLEANHGQMTIDCAKSYKIQGILEKLHSKQNPKDWEDVYGILYIWFT